MDKPYKLLNLKPERGYVLFLTSGVFTYEMELNPFHIEMAMAGKLVIVDSTSMTMFNPAVGDWFKLRALSEIIEYGQAIADNGCKGEDTGIVACPGDSKERKKKRKTSA